MNITGFLIWTRGSSLPNESAIACWTMPGSQIEICSAFGIVVSPICEAGRACAFCHGRVLSCSPAHVDMHCARGAPNASSSARFSSSTLTRARPRNPNVGGSVCAAISSRTRSTSTFRRARHTRRLQLRRVRRNVRIHAAAARRHHLRRHLARRRRPPASRWRRAVPAPPSGDPGSTARSCCRRSTRRCSPRPTAAAGSTRAA